MRYVWNPDKKIYHDTQYSQERCNIDDLIRYVSSDTVPTDKRLCKWCLKSQTARIPKE